MAKGRSLAIMQPYFLPYIGYWQLMKSVNTFVIYDNIQFTKKGWIHRNNYLKNGEPELFSLPLKKASDYLDVKDRFLAKDRKKYINKILNQFESAYRRAPFFDTGINIFKQCICNDESNLFKFILHSINIIREYLDISTELIVSSNIPVDHSCKGRDKVVAICKEINASRYINPIGGLSLYKKKEFLEKGIVLEFQKVRNQVYDQGIGRFVPNLSIIDIIMFNSKDRVISMLYEMDTF